MPLPKKVSGTLSIIVDGKKIECEGSFEYKHDIDKKIWPLENTFHPSDMFCVKGSESYYYVWPHEWEQMQRTAKYLLEKLIERFDGKEINHYMANEIQYFFTDELPIILEKEHQEFLDAINLNNIGFKL